MRLIVGACFPQEITQREDFDSIAVNYYKRWDMTTQEDIDISVLQQQVKTLKADQLNSY